MKKLLLPLLLLVAMAVQSQNSQMFNRMTELKYSKDSWTEIANHTDTDYIVTLNLKEHTLLVTRSSDKQSLKFIQVMSFVNKRGTYTITGLYVDDKSNTYPVCGTITPETFELNLGQLIFHFYNKKYSDKL